jgi:hypothetical protein
MKTKNQSKPISLYLLIGSMIFLGGGGLYGGIMFLTDPSGGSMQLSTDNLSFWPIKDYFWPGIFLIIVMGIIPLTLVYLLWARPDLRLMQGLTLRFREHWVWTLALALSIVLIGWMIVEIVTIGLIAAIQYVIGIFSLVMLGLVLLPSIRKYYFEG